MTAKQPNKRVTLSEIARRTGVSRQVVSAILQPERESNIRYSPETLEKVMEVAREVNYRPNRTARSLISQKHGSLGILVQNSGNITSQVMQSMLQAASARDQVLIFDPFANDKEMPRTLREDCVDGIIVFEDIPQIFQDKIEQLQIPWVQVNCNTMDQPGSVTYDELGGMEQAVEHLTELGRQNLAIVIGPGTHYSRLYRKNGFVKSTSKRGIDGLVYERQEQEGNGIVKFLKEHPDIDGVVLSIDGMASEFYRAARKLGKRIPEDIAVIGVNNFEISRAVTPQLTALGVDQMELGTLIISLLNDFIDGRKPKVYPTLVPFRLHVRESTVQ